MLDFNDSCAEIGHSKEFVDLATAGRHRRFSTIYLKHNLFHQSKLGRDVELQNTHKKQTIAYATAQIAEIFHQSFMYLQLETFEILGR